MRRTCSPNNTELDKNAPNLTVSFWWCVFSGLHLRLGLKTEAFGSCLHWSVETKIRQVTVKQVEKNFRRPFRKKRLRPVYTICGRNLNMQVYLYSLAYRSPLSENALQAGGVWKRRLCILVGIDANHFQNVDFRKRWSHTNNRGLHTSVAVVTDCCVFKSGPGVSCETENILMRFHGQSAIFKFLRVMYTGRRRFFNFFSLR